MRSEYFRAEFARTKGRRMASKLEKRLESMKRSRANLGRRAREKKQSMQRSVTAAATGYGAGWLQKNGYLDRLPSIAGVPRIGVAAVAVHGASMFTKGKTAEHLSSAGDALLAITAFGAAADVTVSGHGGTVAGDEWVAAMTDAVAGFDDDDDIEGDFDDDDDIEGDFDDEDDIAGELVAGDYIEGVDDAEVVYADAD